MVNNTYLKKNYVLYELVAYYHYKIIDISGYNCADSILN